MSHHEHDDSHHGDNCGGGPDTRFLDFELDKVMYDGAESLVREASRELLNEAIKKRLQEVWGERITALANLAVDEFVADVEANLQIQALIVARNEAHGGVEAKVRRILHGGDDEASAEAEDASGDGGE